MSWRNHPTTKPKGSGLKPGQRVRFAHKRDKNEPVIVQVLRLHGWTVVEMTGTPGFPDLVCTKAGRIVLLEVKGLKGTLTDAQRKMHGKLARGGVAAHVVRTPEEALEAVSAEQEAA